ncbi:MAG: hypothetical protein KGD64_12825, partial [Candidatus Heimdallarchaeota archaeon]|nr:hypothetical protein [Candidatus Heimdallarchaeota archaeon]
SNAAYIFAIIAFIISMVMAGSSELSTHAIIVAIIGGSLLVTGAVIGLQKEEIEFERQSLKSEEKETEIEKS